MATKRASSKARRKKPVHFSVLAPCCSEALDLVLQGTVFSAEINGTKIDNVKKISLTSFDPMTVVGLSPEAVFTSFKPWRVYIVKGEVGEIQAVKGGKISAKSKKTKPKKRK